MGFSGWREDSITAKYLLFFIAKIVKKQLKRPHRILYRHAETPDFMRVWAYRTRSVLKAPATYFCKVGQDFGGFFPPAKRALAPMFCTL